MRSYSSLSYLGKEHLLFNETQSSDGNILLSEAVLMFGGDIHLPKNTFLEDMWILTLDQLKSFTMQDHDEQCRDLLHPSRTELNPWDWSCGLLASVNSSLQCTWEEIIRMAWCLKQFQSFVSPI